MKKLSLVLILMFTCLALVGCGRKNDAKTLQIAKHSGSSFKVKVLDDSYKFGTVFINVKDEKLVSFEIEYKSGYTYSDDSYIKIGSYYAEFKKEDSGKAVTMTITNPLNLVLTVDGSEKANENEVKLYAKFTDSSSSSSTTTLTVNPKELVEFIRNKSL